MSRPKVSIAGLTTVVAILAIDCAVLRYAVNVGGGIDGNGPRGFLWVVLPMLTALVFGLPRVVARRAGPFLIGFEASGWCVVLAYGAAVYLFPVTIANYFNGVFGPTYNALAARSHFGIPRLSAVYMWLFMIPATSIVLATPLLIVAILGGLAGLGIGLARRRSRRRMAIA